MKVSAYASASASVPDVADAVVIFLHDFYDSPHVYHDLVFPDFWTWTCFTIDTLLKSGTKFFVKPHPNQISLSSDALTVLAKKYPGLPLLSASITNVQLAKAGMLCGVTMYGTVAHELAYLGVPTIACARHPHHSFDFCRTARSIEEYQRYLCDPQKLPIGRAEMRFQALAFYYMHNLYGDPEDRSLRAVFASFWTACNSPDATEAAALRSFNELRNSSAFRLATEQML